MAKETQTPEQLEKKIAALEQLLAERNAESTAKDAIIEQQDEQLKAANAQGAAALSVVTHAGKQYQVLAGQFSLDDKLVKHHELKTNAELVQKLVEEKSPLLLLIAEAK